MTHPITGHILRLSQAKGTSADSPLWHRIMADTFPIQREFVLNGDLTDSGRGAGKSNGHARKFHRRSHAYPGKSSVFVTLSTDRSRDILLPALEDLSERYNLGLREYRKANAVIWPNGYRVLFRGCKDRNEANKRRGTPWVEAGWDECDAIASNLLEYDIHECVEPRLIDFNGNWAASGTPSAIPRGYWHKLLKESPQYKVVHWDARDNPHMPNVLAYFVKALTRMDGVPERAKWPVGVTSIAQLFAPEYVHLLPARFVREYLGLWVMDVEALIYRIRPKNNYSGDMPFEPTRVTIGLDLGGADLKGPNEKLDRTAICVAQSCANLPTIWIPEAYTMTDVTVDGLARHLLELLARYPDATVEIDSASAGKIIEKTFKKMGIPIKAAEKGPKLRRIQLVQAAIYHGHLRLHLAKTMDLRNEATSLVWDDTRTVHSERCADDAWDALLMATMPHFGDMEEQEDEQPKHNAKPGSPEASAKQEADELEEAYQQAVREIEDEAA